MADFLELIPIDHPPFGDSVSALNATIDSQFLQDAPMSIPVSLKTARRFLGNLWLPNYLPEGFDIDNAGVTNSDREHPDLIFLSSKSGKEYGQIILSVHRAEAYTHEYVPTDYESRVTSVDLDGSSGLMIRGNWVMQLNEDGTIRSAGWDDMYTRRLILRDPTLGQVITLDVIPAQLVTEEELIRIAQSLKLSRSYRSWLPWLSRG